jgi:tRNA isopentenyl-2-thiomethyl-A-37 hydroxylase MiaE
MIESIAAAIGLLITLGSITMNTSKNQILAEVDRKIARIDQESCQLKQELVAFQLISQERDKNMFEAIGELKQIIRENGQRFENTVKRFHERVDELEDSFASRGK